MRIESKWSGPLVGRDDEFGRALAALDDGAEPRGVVLVGGAGAGKSALARALSEELRRRGRTVRFALGTSTGCAVPLGAFSRVVSLDVAHEPAVMLAAAYERLGRDENLVVVVDDAQLLDPLSAALVNQLAAGRGARLIVTIRSGEPVLDAVTALLKERLLRTVHVDPFTREQTGVLARAVLDGAVQARLVDQLYERSAGNVLVLRGLLSAGRESGAVVRADDVWQLRGPLRGDRELYELLEFRLRSLAPEELEVVEVLATAELLEWEILREVCDADAAARLERRGVIQLVADGSHTLAHLNNPMLGEAAIRHAGVVRSRQLNGMLAHTLARLLAEGRRSRLPDLRGRIRLAQFMVRSDIEPQLEVICEAAADALAMSDIALAEELARFAFDRGGGLRAGLVLAEALSWQGHGQEAEQVLVETEPDGADDGPVARWGCLRAANLFWGCADVEAAVRVLNDVKKRVTSDPGLHLVAALEVSIGFFGGDVATAIGIGPSLVEADLAPMATVWAAIPTCLAMAAVGRFGEVSRIADAALRATTPCGLGLQRFNIGMAEIFSMTCAGDYLTAERVWQRYAAMAAGMPAAEAMVRAMRGFVQLARGDLPSACTAFNDSIPLLSGGFPSPWLVAVAAQHAMAEGARGNNDAAAAALQTAKSAYGPHVAVFLPALELASAWERASAGQMAAAQAHAARAAQVAEQAGMHAVEMRARHQAVRFGDRSHAARLAELATILATPLAEAVGDHARGLVKHDPGLVDAAARRFSELGAPALAADASAQAAGEYARRGDRGKRFESSTWTCSLASKYELRTPAIKDAAAPLSFSSREHEIATLVAAGLSNRQIADRLVVSVRTVEGHLYRIFAKLGISTRDQLIHLLTLTNLLSRDPAGHHGSAVRPGGRFGSAPLSAPLNASLDASLDVTLDASHQHRAAG